jgi:hypothetical protein
MMDPDDDFEELMRQLDDTINSMQALTESANNAIRDVQRYRQAKAAQPAGSRASAGRS